MSAERTQSGEVYEQQADTAATPAGSPARVLILGDEGGLAEALGRRLTRLGIEASAASGPDGVLAQTLAQPSWDAVAVLTHDDARALRLTLLCTHVRPELPLWVTLFDHSILHQLHEIAPRVNVVQTAELVASRLADHCLAAAGPGVTHGARGVRIVDDALRLMLIAGGGLLATLVVQVLITVAALHDGLIDAVYYSTRALATVADAPGADRAGSWFKLASTLTTVVSVVLLAVFTAAVVRRLSRSRLTTLLGPRRAVARGHILVVGFGQVGFRLAQELRRRGVGVIALEPDVDAPCVRLARRAGIPVAVGRGDDRSTLELVGVRRCAAVAAVTSDDLVNVAVGLAATDVRAGVPLVLRLGDGDVAAETESMLHLGRICDAHDLIARRLVDELTRTLRPAGA